LDKFNTCASITRNKISTIKNKNYENIQPNVEQQKQNQNLEAKRKFLVRKFKHDKTMPKRDQSMAI
jgi:hypothetical protein